MVKQAYCIIIAFSNYVIKLCFFPKKILFSNPYKRIKAREALGLCFTDCNTCLRTQPFNITTHSNTRKPLFLML